jgi:hypothetical protein
MKINEVLQPRHKEEYASAHYRVVVDTKRVTPAMLFSPEYWESNTVLKKGDIMRCVADDGSYAFDLIVDSQKLDASKSVKNIVAVSMFPDITDAVFEAATARAAEKAAELAARAAAQEVVQAAPKPVSPPPAAGDKPAIDTNVSYAKRQEIKKRQKLVAKRAEFDAANKARTAERLAAEAAGDAA